ncbi:TVP38/TMEM64 family protein [Methyloterricola oryzae]|uniref:TVP38/TMEM64 family protein n=1 Tax=Methyloterricola oryzae TaxID=1495050 RepID=UPI0011AF0B1D|nr:VTT domain-containing protein [Methyloterricola oryzae]
MSGLLLTLGFLTLGVMPFMLRTEYLAIPESEFRGWLASSGYAAPAIFLLASALLTAMGMPRLLFCSMAGMVFGFAWGMIWGQLGTLLGAYGTFLFARMSGREYILGRFPRVADWARPIESRGWIYVLLIRQLPVAGLYNDILLGISPVRHRDFWIGTALGFLPLGCAATLTGAGLIQGESLQITQMLVLAACIGSISTFGLKWTLSRIRARRI